MRSDEAGTEATVAASGPITWRVWLARVTSSSWQRLASVGIALLLGLGAGALALAVFAYLADEVAEQSTERVDQSVLEWFRHGASPALDVVARGLSALGAEGLAVALVGLLFLFAYQRRWGAAVAITVVTIGAQLLNTLLKSLFHRTRPAPVTAIIPAQEFAFPSGHAMVSTAFYLFLAYIAWRTLDGSLRILTVGILAALVFLIGVSRLYLGVHYLSDVVAGYLAGFIWTDTVIVAGYLLPRLLGRR